MIVTCSRLLTLGVLIALTLIGAPAGVESAGEVGASNLTTSEYLPERPESSRCAFLHAADVDDDIGATPLL